MLENQAERGEMFGHEGAPVQFVGLEQDLRLLARDQPATHRGTKPELHNDRTCLLGKERSPGGQYSTNAAINPFSTVKTTPLPRSARRRDACVGNDR